MKPYYQDDAVTLYHGDCRDVLPSICAVDMVLTDIPYGKVNRESGGLRSLHKGNADEADGTETETVCQLQAFTHYVFCGTEQVSSIRAAFVAMGYTTRLGIWEKSNPSPMNGESLWLSGLECCVFARKAGAVFNEHCVSPIWKGPTMGSTDHPTEKPLWLFKRLVLASSTVGQVVLDPFAGSGTTLVAAKELNRQAIGIELDEKYCEMAAMRLSQGVLDLGI